MERSRWSVIIPVSSAATAKSRLASLGPARQALAQAFAQDVVDVAAQVDSVGLVIVVGDGSLRLTGNVELVDPGEVGLNAALVRAEGHARSRGYQHIAVLMADLPCITAADLATLLTSARSVPRGFVRDYRGIGTTVITTTGPALMPRFGSGSARSHQVHGAWELPAPPPLKFDVDDPGDIGMALLLGIGTATSTTLAAIRINTD